MCDILSTVSRHRKQLINVSFQKDREGMNRKKRKKIL